MSTYKPNILSLSTLWMRHFIQRRISWTGKIKSRKKVSPFFKVRSTSKNKLGGITNCYYACHRSGRCKLKQNRIRRVKASGSIRIGSHCPAFIKVITKTVDEISEIKVQYQSVHVGHDLETRTPSLKRKDRENIAACLKLGIPMDKILEDAKRNFSPTNPYWHLTRKHLHNIRKSFGIPLSTEKPKKVIDKDLGKSLNAGKPKKVSCRDFGKLLNTGKPKKDSSRNFGISLNTGTFQNVNFLKNADVEASDSSIGYEDYCEFEISNNEEVSNNEEASNNEEVSNNEKVSNNDKVCNNEEVSNTEEVSNNEEVCNNEKVCNNEEVSNHEEIQEYEKNTAVSSLLLLQQNHDYSKELGNRKLQIISQLKELETRIEKWNPEYPLPDVEEHIKAINARLDMSAPSIEELHVQEVLPIFTLTPTNKPIIKRGRITKRRIQRKPQQN